MKVVTFGSVLESTPEGLHDMDRVNMELERHRREAEAIVRPEFLDLIAEMEERAFLFGTMGDSEKAPPER